MTSFYLSMLFALLMLSGCSSSGSSNIVEGASYNCEPIGGITNYDGVLNIRMDAPSSIGGITLGEILASDINTTDTKVYISELLGLDRNNISDPTLIQVLQILQTLDEDNNATNDIEITAQTRTDLAGTTLDLTTGTVTTAQISAAIFAATGKILVDANIALVHYMTTLITDLGLTFDIPALSSFTTTLAENSTTGDTNITAITFSGSGAADFSVATDDTITVVNAPDFETQPSYSLTAVATNLSGNSDSVSVTITVTNVVDIAPTLAAC